MASRTRFSAPGQQRASSVKRMADGIAPFLVQQQTRARTHPVLLFLPVGGEEKGSNPDLIGGDAFNESCLRLQDLRDLS